jgi:adenosine deaminase
MTAPVLDEHVAQLIAAVPKAELHVHLEGTITPRTALQAARRNSVALPFTTEEELQAAYRFTGLPDFLRVLFQVARTLRQPADFYDLTLDYLGRAAADHVVRAEVFFGAQTFLDAGVRLPVMLDGVLAAFADARAQWGIDAQLICTAQRHRDEAEGLELMEMLAPWREQIIGIGLGSAERGNPPRKYARFFETARRQGYRLTVHAGEDGPADYVREALDVVRADRIDHGVALADDAALIERVRSQGVPLTMCPLSNRALGVVPDLADHPLKRLLHQGLIVTVNSDDPPFFGGYLNDNYRVAAAALDLTADDILALARNSIHATFADDQTKTRMLDQIQTTAETITATRPSDGPATKTRSATEHEI